VILGRIQSVKSEVDVDFCRQNNITISRRITGGGTVYHDLGNLNISYFFPISFFPGKANIQTATIHLTRFLVSILEKMGYRELKMENGSNIFWNRRKISGSAGRFRQSWFLHHATLLHNANLQHLEESILARSSDPADKSGSRYFPTVNLTDFSLTDFIENFRNRLHADFDLCLEENTISNKEKEYAEFLKEKNYEQENWIFDKKMKPYKISDYA
jgi:lipoate-protein ligase A